jgi:hypothetical protein
MDNQNLEHGNGKRKPIKKQREPELKHLTYEDLAKIPLPVLPPESVADGLTWEAMVKLEPKLGKLLKEIEQADTSEKCWTEQWHLNFKKQMTKLARYDARPERLRTRKAYDLAYRRLYHEAPACQCWGCTKEAPRLHAENSTYNQWCQQMNERTAEPVAFEWPPAKEGMQTFAKKVAHIASLPEGTQVVIVVKDGDEEVIIDKFIIERGSPPILQDKACVMYLAEEWERLSKLPNIEELIRERRVWTENYFLPMNFLERRIAGALEEANKHG